MKKILAIVLAAVMCLAVFAGCADTQEPDGTVTYNIENAVAYVKNMYKTYLTENETAADFRLTTQIIVDKATFTVAWTTNTDKVTVELDEENKEAIINVDEKSPEVVEYELKATVTAPDGTSGELVFQLIVPKYSVSGYDEYFATEAGKAVVVNGIVVAVHSVQEGNKYNQLYVQDESGKGGYYVYSMTEDPKDLGIQMGMTVSVTGTKDIYSGTHEIKDATVVVTDSTVKDITPLDITEVFKNAESLKDEALTSKLGMLVTIKGVEITGQDKSEKSMYFKFKLDSLESYIRVYDTDCPASVTDEQMATIIAEHGKHTGWTANVTGVVVMYSGAIYLNPVSVNAFEYLSEIERTPEEKLNVEAENISIDSAVNFDTDIELPLKGKQYEDITISWTSDNYCAVVGENGKLVVTLQKEAQEVTLIATLSLGEATKTVTFKLNVAAMPTVVPSVVTEPKENTAYKFYLTQKNLGKLYYINGEMSGYYMATVESSDEAIDVYAELVDGGFKLYVNSPVDGTKTYISIVSATGTDGKEHINAVYSTTDGCVFTMNTEYNTPVAVIGEDTYYLGTYGTNSTFGASKISYASTSFVGQLATMIDTSSVSDADKIAAEKDALTISKDTFSMDGSLDLAIKGTTYGDVQITWASDDTCAVIDSATGKLTITLQKEEKKVTLTATIKCGEATDTKSFEISVDKKSILSITVQDQPAAEMAYTFYFVQAQAGKTLYLDGGVDGKYLTTTTDYSKSVKVYAEAVTGGYKFYIMNDGAKLYINAVVNSDGNKLNYAASSDTVYSYDSDTFAWTFTVAETKYYLGTYLTYETVSISKASYISASSTRVSQFPLELVTLSCTHEYAFDCSEACSSCGAVRTTTVAHTYTNNCDADCNVCGETREAPHVYDNACDGDCNECDYTRTPAAHVDENEDNICDVCQKNLVFNITVVTKPAVDTAYKFYVNQGNLNQNLFINGKMSGYYGATVTTAFDGIDVYLETAEGGYKLYFKNGETKQYINFVKSTSYVNVKYQAEGTTVYTFDTTYNTFIAKVEDVDYFLGSNGSYPTVGPCTTSNIAAKDYFVVQLATYTCEHSYSSDCDMVCDECGASRDVTAEHTYTNSCDTDCNVCGYTREITHTDTNNDGVCDICGQTVSAAIFEFGANDSTKQETDGSAVGEGIYTNNGYTLTLTDVVKVYEGAYDAKGNSCLKLGTGSAVGSFKFTVNDNINSVVIKVAGYKSAKAKINVNGTDHEITKYSSNGEYVEITVDTTTTKTVSFTTVSSAYRCKIDSIAFFN